MNKIDYILVMVLMVLLSGCNSLFDKEIPEYQVSDATAVTDQASAETALLGVYSYLGDYGVFSAYYLVDDAYRCGLLEGTYRSSDYERNLEALSVPSEHRELLEKWKLCGQMINAANNLLAAIEKVNDANFVGGRKKEIIAEARFLRAFAQLYLMKHYAFFWDLDSKYGPLMRRVPGTLSNNNMERSGVRETYDLILEDLDYAIDYGPVYKDVFSASRGLAKGFKVEVLLLRGTDEDYAKVPELANEVLSNYEFKLEESFEDVFKNGYKSTEIMFSRFLSAKKLADVDMNVASIKKLMCGKYKPNDQFFDIFNSTNDIRYALTFDSVLYEQFNSTNKTLILKKLWRTDGNCPMFYMRLAQMKLFQAEALEHNGASVADVLAPLNDLRQRSGNVLLKAEDFSDRDDLVRIIFYEIVREMGLENGAEWFAAVRMRLSSGKRLISELNPVYSDDKQLAWQIPDDEVSYNTLMEPNPVFIRE